MKYVAIIFVWLSVAAAVAAVGYFTHDPKMTAALGLFGFVAAVVATMVLAEPENR